jgi:hypothetical protein
MNAQNKKSKTLWAVLGPFSLGIGLALIFLFNYISKKPVILVIHNRTGIDLLGGGVRLDSELKEEEIGPIADKDSTVFQFRKGGHGAYHFTGKLRTGRDFAVTGGLVPKGAAVRQALVLEAQGDSLTGRFPPAAP